MPEFQSQYPDVFNEQRPFNVDLYDDASVKSLLNQYNKAIETIYKHIASPVSADEREQALKDINEMEDVAKVQKLLICSERAFLVDFQAKEIELTQVSQSMMSMDSKINGFKLQQKRSVCDGSTYGMFLLFNGFTGLAMPFLFGFLLGSGLSLMLFGAVLLLALSAFCLIGAIIGYVEYRRESSRIAREVPAKQAQAETELVALKQQEARLQKVLKSATLVNAVGCNAYDSGFFSSSTQIQQVFNNSPAL